MIDPEGLIFGPVLLDGVEQLTGGVEILTEGFLDDDAVGTIGRMTLLLEMLGYRDEHARGQGEIEDAIGLLGCITGLDLFEGGVQNLERFGVVVTTGDVAGEALELLECGIEVGVAFRLLDVRGDAFVIFSIVHLCTRIPDDFYILGQVAHTIETEEGWVGLAIGG